MNINNYIDSLVEERRDMFTNIDVTEIDYIPFESDVKLEVGKWYSIPNAVAVFADMERSTEISFRRHPKTGAKLYELFTGSWISVLDDFGAHYIDIKGDGGFGLFHGRTGIVQAIACAVTMQTALKRQITPESQKILRNSVKQDEMNDWNLRAKIGIHKGKLLVKRIGKRNRNDMRMSWMVWAGKPVNYSAKLSSSAQGGTILATDSIVDSIKGNQDLRDLLYMSCGCPEDQGELVKNILWKQLAEDHKIYSLIKSSQVYELGSTWCPIHGDAYLAKLISYLKNEGVKIKI